MRRILKASVLVIVLASAALSGCASIDTARDKVRAYGENVPKIDPIKVGSYITDQNSIYEKLVRLEPITDNNHRPIVNSGMMYVDMRCARYIDALFWFNRVKEGANRQLGYLGAASAAILEILNASSELISLAPIGFKFATETVDSVGKGLLYDMSPGAVRGIVAEQQAAFKKAIEGQSYQSKTAALQVVQAYLMLCLPASIEGQVENAVKQAKFKEKDQPSESASNNDATPVKTVETVTTQQSADGKDLTTPSTITTITTTSVSVPSAKPAATEPKVDKVPILEMVGNDGSS